MKPGSLQFSLLYAVTAVALRTATTAYAVLGGARVEVVAPVAETTGQDLDFGLIIAGSTNSRLTVPATSDTIIVSSGDAVPVGGSASRARFDVAVLPLTLIIIAIRSSI